MHGVAILGGGIFAKSAHLPAIKDVPEFSLKAVWSRSSSSAESVKAEASRLSFPSSSSIDVYSESPSSSSSTSSSSAGDLSALLARKDIQTVILSLPIPSQPDIIKRSFEAGRNVISEKPVAKDVESSKALIELWEKEYRPKGIHWIVAEQFPYEPAYIEARKVLASGEIGELRSFSMDWFLYNGPDGKYSNTAWRKTPEYQGGFILDGGVHFVAGLRWALGGYKDTELTAVTAVASQIQSHLPPHDTVQGLLQTSTGPSGNFNISFAHEETTPVTYTFRGSKAILRIAMNANREYQVTLSSSEKGTISEKTLPSIGVPEEMKAFGKAIIAGWDSEEVKECYMKSGPRAAMGDVAVIEGALKGSESGKWVTLDSY